MEYMEYKVEYKSINEIASLIKKPAQLIDINYDIVKIQKEITSICYDILIIFNGVYLLNLLCSDKRTLDLIYNLPLYKAKNNTVLSKLYRCIIINYSNIIELMDYEEFCSRYK